MKQLLIALATIILFAMSVPALIVLVAVSTVLWYVFIPLIILGWFLASLKDNK